MGLNAIGLQLDVIGVNVAPFGLRVTADVLLLGEAVTPWMVGCGLVIVLGTTLSTGILKLPNLGWSK